jgi:hypothetical protein
LADVERDAAASVIRETSVNTEAHDVDKDLPGFVDLKRRQVFG